MGAMPVDERNFAETFLNHAEYGEKYKDKIRNTISDGRYRLIVNMNDLRQVNSQRAAE